MQWIRLKKVSCLYSHADVPGSTAAQLRVRQQFHVNTLETHSTWLASISIAAQTINPTKAYLRIAPDPTPPAGP